VLYVGQGIVKTIFVVVIATTVIPAHAQPSPLPLVPTPQQLELRAGATQLSGRWEVQIMADRPVAVGVDGLIADVRQAWGWSWRTGRGRGRHAVIVRPRASFRSKNPLVDAQGYDLRVEGDSIVIAAPTETGRYYGVQTLRQLLRGSPSGILRRMSIHDYPSLAWRGVSDDISRGAGLHA